MRFPLYNPPSSPVSLERAAPPPDWKLPEGVPRGVWEYAHRDHIAGDYDDEFAANTLFDFDEEVLRSRFTRPGELVDLGCGTGRALVPFARRGFACTGVDLSPEFLRIVGEKAALESLPIRRVRANLIELDCFADGVFDYACCLFSTLGMIRGRDRRRQALRHFHRILKPGGTLVVHVHNLWHNLRERLGRGWLLRHLAYEQFRRDVERGDKFFPYRGIREMYLHLFTRRGFVRELIGGGFEVLELIALDTARRHRLARPWFFGDLRANGWIAVCRPG